MSNGVGLLEKHSRPTSKVKQPSFMESSFKACWLHTQPHKPSLKSQLTSVGEQYWQYSGPHSLNSTSSWQTVWRRARTDSWNARRWTSVPTLAQNLMPSLGKIGMAADSCSSLVASRRVVAHASVFTWSTVAGALVWAPSKKQSRRHDIIRSSAENCY